MLYLLPQAVDRAAERDPNQVAVRCRNIDLTYGELSRCSNALAHRLVDLGIARGDRVGILAGKGLQTTVSMYGIMKAGACYVPLDPRSPVTRLERIVNSCSMKGLVTEELKRREALYLCEHVLSVEWVVGIEPAEGGFDRAVPWREIETAPDGAPPDVGTIEQDLAYLLYTSGSTGTPKGITHTHRSALSWAEVSASTYGFTSSDRLSNHAPLHFDLSTLDYFSTALVGATTVIVPEEYTKLPASLSKLMADERLTVLYCVPFALIQLLLHGALETRDLAALRWVLFGGEPFATKHLRALMNKLPHARFSNVYGPTEVNGCTYFVIPSLSGASDEPVPIGRPYANIEALIVDPEDAPVAPGEIGELLIRSPTMMQGYWGNPELTERALYARPHAGAFEDLFHRTGDLVQELSDGNLRFVGRKDRQVKIRGHRVELDEIESALSSHDAVAESAAYLVFDDGSQPSLHAGVTLKESTSTTPRELHRHLLGLVPSYAIPERIDILDGFPRTSTGKIDRRLLAETDTGKPAPRGEVHEGYLDPLHP